MAKKRTKKTQSKRTKKTQSSRKHSRPLIASAIPNSEWLDNLQVVSRSPFPTQKCVACDDPADCVCQSIAVRVMYGRVEKRSVTAAGQVATTSAWCDTCRTAHQTAVADKIGVPLG